MPLVLNVRIRSTVTAVASIVNRLVDTPQEVLTEAIALAAEVANQNPLSVRTMIRSIRMQEDELLEVALRREADVQ